MPYRVRLGIRVVMEESPPVASDAEPESAQDAATEAPRVSSAPLASMVPSLLPRPSGEALWAQPTKRSRPIPSPEPSPPPAPILQPTRFGQPVPRKLGVLDLLAAGGFAAAAALLAAILPMGDPLRLWFTLPILLLVPGYLLIEAIDPGRTAARRALHALLGLGVSPALLGLLALMTATLPGGFRSGVIIAVVTTACLGLAAFAVRRRRSGAAAESFTPPSS